jgi:hypothetical protein
LDLSESRFLGGECRGGSSFQSRTGKLFLDRGQARQPLKNISKPEKRRLLDIFDRLRRDGIDHEVEIRQRLLDCLKSIH